MAKRISELLRALDKVAISKTTQIVMTARRVVMLVIRDAAPVGEASCPAR